MSADRRRKEDEEDAEEKEEDFATLRPRVAPLRGKGGPDREPCARWRRCRRRSSRTRMRS